MAFELHVDILRASKTSVFFTWIFIVLGLLLLEEEEELVLILALILILEFGLGTLIICPIFIIFGFDMPFILANYW